MILSGKARLAGVMGWPVAHSRSPRLHGYWLERYGIDGAYVPLPVHPDRFTEALRALPALGFRGVNITVPHKEAALAACDHVDGLARRVGAVNTVVVQDGRLFGSNTDVYGFMTNIREGTPDWAGDGRRAIVLGAGGAARAVCVGLLDAGFVRISLVNRSGARAAALVDALDAADRIRILAWDDVARGLADTDLLVNTTTLGMEGHPALDIDLAPLPWHALVTDIVYTPLETPLLAAARARGNPVVDGLGMLLHQAKPGFAAWFETEPVVDEDLRTFVLEDLA